MEDPKSSPDYIPYKAAKLSNLTTPNLESWVVIAHF